MRTQINVLAALLALALLVPPAATAQYGQDTQKDRPGDQDHRSQMQHQKDQQASRDFQPKLCHADELIGAAVKNEQGEEIGNIKDLVMDSQRQSVSYAVLAFGGFLGLGEDLRAIPWQALTIERGASESGERGMRSDRADRNRHQDGEINVVLNATKEQLENAEGFSDDDWPDTGNERWTQNVHSSFYGKAGNKGPKTTTMADRGMDADRRDDDKAGKKKTMESRRLTNIMGESVKSHGDDDIGEIKSVLIDVNRGDLAYAVVDVSDLEDLGDTEQVAIPWRSLQTRGEQLSVTTEVASLGRMKYEEDGLQKLESRVRATEQHALSQSEPYWQGPGDADQRYGQGQQRDDEQVDRYGSQAGATTISGKITKVMNETQIGGEETLRFEVTTDDGRRIIVDAGQKSDDGDMQMKCKKGDQVTVTGTQKTEGDGQSTFMAQTVRSGSNVLNVERTNQDRKHYNR